MLEAMVRAAAAALLLLAIGCAAEPHQALPDDGPFDPLAGAYPQIHWMFNVYEVPLQAEIGPDGLLRAADGRANGLGLVDAAQVPALFDSISAFPGTRHRSSPSLLAVPDQEARLQFGLHDKAGASIGELAIAITGRLAGRGIETELEVTDASPGGGAGCGTGPMVVAEGGALLLICRGTDADDPKNLVVARPRILRSVEDYPFQRARVSSASKR